jgi:hypothetical protein
VGGSSAAFGDLGEDDSDAGVAVELPKRLLRSKYCALAFGADGHAGFVIKLDESAGGEGDCPSWGKL